MIIFTDMGDTIVDEGTQIFDSNEEVLSAEPIDQAVEVYKELKKRGHDIILVADGTKKSFENIIHSIGLEEVFSTQIISDEIGTRKPDKKMFELALEKSGYSEEDKSRIVMIGNNLKRDIAGANEFGITSIWLRRFQRYTLVPENEVEIPDFIIKSPNELLALIDYIEKRDEKKK